MAYRRTIDELILRYELEPTLRDMVVEGADDSSLFSWYCKERGIDVSVYEIDTVDVPVDILREPGNRGRVVALADALELQLDPKCDAVKCIVDSDLNRLLPSLSETRILWLTDYSSLEAYAWSEATVGKLFGLVLRRELPAGMLASMTSALKRSFLARAAKMVVAPDMPWVTFTRCCVVRNSAVAFDHDDHARRIYEAGGRAELAEVSLAWIRENESRLTEDDRHYIHGHDMIELSAWVARQLSGRADLCEPKHVHRALFGCMEVSKLSAFAFFQRLELWATN